MFGALIYILIFQSARSQSCRLAAFREHSAPLKAARAVARDTNVVVTIRLKTGCSRDKKNEGTVQRCAPCCSTPGIRQAKLPREFKEGTAIKSTERSSHLRDCRITRRFVHGKKVYRTLQCVDNCEITVENDKSIALKIIFMISFSCFN